MSVIVIKRRAKKAFEVPEGGIILWYGIATDVPDDWAIDAYAKDAFVRGASEGNANNVKVGSTFVHKHTYASKTSAVAPHTHSTTASGTTGSASGSQAHYGTANENAATTNHTHSVSGTRKTDSKGGHDHAMQDTGETEVYHDVKTWDLKGSGAGDGFRDGCVGVAGHGRSLRRLGAT